MTTSLFMLLLVGSSPAQDADDLKRDMKALELFLQDEKTKGIEL